MSKLKSKSEKVQNIISDVNNSTLEKEKEPDLIFENLERKVLQYYENEIKTLNEANEFREKTVNARMDSLERFRMKLNSHLVDIDGKLVDLISDADYRKENLPLLMQSTNFLSEVEESLTKVSRSEKIEDVVFEKKEFILDADRIREKLSQVFKVRSEEKDLNSIVPLY